MGFRIPDFHKVAIKTICKRTNSTISRKVSRYNSKLTIGEEGTHDCYGHQAFRDRDKDFSSERTDGQTDGHTETQKYV